MRNHRSTRSQAMRLPAATLILLAAAALAAGAYLLLTVGREFEPRGTVGALCCAAGLICLGAGIVLAAPRPY